ncbi:MAG TPA: EAL domain-containing protein [Dyella sp.]|uniref:EAL domain-containing protein n=1 Tax=Dyella sp. TaxID=1869338 RepID=UPI002F929C2C
MHYGQNLSSAMYVRADSAGEAFRFVPSVINDTVLTSEVFDTPNLKKYLERKLRAFFQPQMRMDGQVVGVEALARLWDDRLPGASKVAPVAYINRAGLLPFMTLALVEQVLDVSAGALMNCGQPLPVSINLQAEQLLDVSLLDAITRALEARGLVASGVTLEIVETGFHGDPDKLLRWLDSARAMGYRLSLDDFGTGESNFHRLVSYPVQEWKLAREIVNGVAACKIKAVLVRKLLEMGAELGLTTVVEGVDRMADLDWLCNAGYPDMVIQGYVVARPMPAGRLAGWLSGRMPAVTHD